MSNVEDIYPLSPLQQGMLFHVLYAPEPEMYAERIRYTIRGDMKVSAFERAWQRVVERHPVLRTAFLWTDVDEPLQIVLRRVKLPLERHDWRGLSAGEQQARLQAYRLI